MEWFRLTFTLFAIALCKAGVKNLLFSALKNWKAMLIEWALIIPTRSYVESCKHKIILNVYIHYETWVKVKLNLSIVNNSNKMCLNNWYLYTYHIQQGSSNLSLEGQCNTEFHFSPNQTHLSKFIKVLRIPRKSQVSRFKQNYAGQIKDIYPTGINLREPGWWILDFVYKIVPAALYGVHCCDRIFIFGKTPFLIPYKGSTFVTGTVSIYALKNTNLPFFISAHCESCHKQYCWHESLNQCTFSTSSRDFVLLWLAHITSPLGFSKPPTHFYSEAPCCFLEPHQTSAETPIPH